MHHVLAGVRLLKEAVHLLVQQCGEESVTSLHVQQALR
jgi:hypothetical protein